MSGLDTLTIPQALIESWFYLRYASLLGHGLNLEYDSDGAKLEFSKLYVYDVSEKGLRLSQSGEVTGDHIKLLRLIGTRPLSVLVQVGGIGELLSLCSHIARAHASVEG
jgi:hypothetical protein